MQRSFSSSLVLALVATVAASAALAAAPIGIPEQTLDVAFDSERGELAGTLTTSFPAPAPEDTDTVYFLLLPNLDRERNPYLTARAIDRRYPYGFEESALDVDRVVLVDGETRTEASFRLLSLPPAWQTYGLADAVLAVDGVQSGSAVEIAFTTRSPRVASGDGGLTDGVLTWRFGWYPLLLDPGIVPREEAGTLTAGDTDAFPLVFPQARITARVAVPADVTLTAGADAVDLEAAPPDDESAVAVYVITNTGPTRSLALTFGPDLERYVLDGPTPIEVTVRKGHVYEARLLATYAREILADFAARYGPYPRERFCIAENPNPDGDALSADGIALMSERFFTHRDILVPAVFHRLTEFVLAHEIAHQWFGIGTGVDLDRDAWLSEGLSQYAAVEYFERVYGATDPNLLFVTGNGLLENVVAKQFGYLNLREHVIELPYLRGVWSGFDEALVKPLAELEYANANAVRLYDKGYLVARALAAATGTEAFERVLRRAVAAGSAGRVLPADLQRWAEEETGASFAAWFAAWVTGNASVDYSVAIVSRVQTESTHETTVRVRRDGGVAQNVEVEAKLVSGATSRQTWDAADEESELVFRTPSFVTRVTIDPDHRLPDRDRINNNAPVRIVVAADAAALPLDAYVLAPDAGSSGVSLSRLDRFRLAVSQERASLVVRRGRGEAFQAGVSFAGQHIEAELAYSLTTFAPVETGGPGTTWEPSFTTSLSAERLVAAGQPLYVMHLVGVDLATSSDAAAAAVGLDVASTGAIRLAAAASDEFGILPQVYARASAVIGYGLGSLPTPLQFTFDELRAVKLPRADAKAWGSLSLDLPSFGDTPFNVAGLAMLDELRVRLYVAGGAGWTDRGGSSTTSIGAEAGMEQVLSLSTLGGFLPFAVRLGVAVPLGGELKPVLYAGFSL